MAGLKPWARKMLAKQGATFNSLEEEYAYIARERQANEQARIAVHRQALDQAERAHYANRVWDRQSQAVAREQNRRFALGAAVAEDAKERKQEKNANEPAVSLADLANKFNSSRLK